MGACSPCSLVFHIGSFLQVVLAAAIAGVVAVKLVHVEVDAGTDGLKTNYTCLLGQDYMSSSLCTYTFVVAGVSLVASMAISLLQCCTCNLCGLGGILDILLAGAGTAWWAVASGVIGSNAKDGLSPGVDPVAAAQVSSARDAVPIMCWVETGLFAVLTVSSIFKCAGCGRGRRD